jgi:putative ATP-binding cassette transporter
MLMEVLVDQTGLTLLSVGHRPELEAFHTRKVELERRDDGARLVRDTVLVEPLSRTLWQRVRRFRPGFRRAAAQTDAEQEPHG